MLNRCVHARLQTGLALCGDGHDDEAPVPAYVEPELRRSLECGILAHGFARARCGDCRHCRRPPTQSTITALIRCSGPSRPSNVLALDIPGNLIDVQLESADVTVPEPGTLGLLALALAGCVVSRRKKSAMRS